MTYWIVGGKRRFNTLDAAKAYAHSIFARAGSIVSIEEKTQ
jgi:hypothetical protein